MNAFSSPVSNEAFGLVRLAFTEMRRDHERMVRAAEAIPVSVAEALAFRGITARNRAWNRLQTIIPDKPMIELERSVTWRMLRPCKQPLSGVDERLPQDGVEVASLTVGLSRGEAVVRDAPWGFFTSRHAAGRLIERARPRADIRIAILTAHDALLNAPIDTFQAAHNERNWAIPVSNIGAFLCTIRVAKYLGTEPIIYVSADTFVDTSQLYPNQRAQVAAIRFQGPGLKLRDGLLAPLQLRAAAVAGDGVAQFSRVPNEKRPRRERRKNPHVFRQCNEEGQRPHA